MNIKSIANAITSKAGRQVLKFQKHSPAILFVAGTAGVVGSVILACRATLRFEEATKDIRSDLMNIRVMHEKKNPIYSTEDYRRDLAVLYARATVEVAKLYGPAVVLGVAAIASLTGSHVILNRRNVALTAAYAAIEKGFNSYRQRVIDKYGPEEERVLRYGLTDREIVEETENGPVVRTIKGLPGKNNVSPYACFFDEFSSEWQDEHAYNLMYIRCQMNYANDLLRSRGHVFLNEVRTMLGLPHTKEGAVVGWLSNGDGDGYIDFGIFSGSEFRGLEFVNGNERSILLDFNVDGVIYDKI